MMNKSFKKIFTFIFLILGLSSLAKSAEMPKQFQSDNSAIILGLENNDHLTVDMIKEASRKLTSTYHPDRLSKKGLSDSEFRE